MTGSSVLRRYVAAVAEAHAELTRLDQASGDGDFGDNLRAGLERVARELDATGSTGHGFEVAGRVFLDEVGGTSGPLFGLLFSEIARALDHDPATGWAEGTAAGLAAIRRVGEAEPGDRTLLDALAPASAELARPGEGAFRRAARAAAAGAHATATMRARQGRASYVGARALGVPDPGAMGIALLFWCLAAVQDPPAPPSPLAHPT